MKFRKLLTYLIHGIDHMSHMLNLWRFQLEMDEAPNIPELDLIVDTGELIHRNTVDRSMWWQFGKRLVYTFEIKLNSGDNERVRGEVPERLWRELEIGHIYNTTFQNISRTQNNPTLIGHIAIQ